MLSYSWRLILAPRYVLDYLAAHEVAHLVEMNHSPPLLAAGGKICPNVARAKAWLDAHGTDLHRYGIAASASSVSVAPAEQIIEQPAVEAAARPVVSRGAFAAADWIGAGGAGSAAWLALRRR